MTDTEFFVDVDELIDLKCFPSGYVGRYIFRPKTIKSESRLTNKTRKIFLAFI